MIFSCVSTLSEFQPLHVVQVFLQPAHSCPPLNAASSSPITRVVEGLRALRVLRAVDEADHGALIEITEAREHSSITVTASPSLAVTERPVQNTDPFLIGADKCSRMSPGVATATRPAADRAERMQLARARCAEQRIPGFGAEAADAGEIACRRAFADRTHHRRRNVAAPGAHRR